MYGSFEPVGEAQIRNHFPNIYRRCLEEGYDITKNRYRLSRPSTILWGIHVDCNSRTTMDRYAVGRPAVTVSMERNRLASNSLLESLVFAQKGRSQYGRGPEKEYQI